MKNIIQRRDFLKSCGRGLILGGAAMLTGTLLTRRQLSAPCGNSTCKGCSAEGQCKHTRPQARNVSDETFVWQIDPRKCVQCGQCATKCVLDLSAVKCIHSYSMCGYCKLCFGFFQPGANALNEGAENQICPTGAIERKLIELPYYEYNIVEELCNGCGKCVKGCGTFGNGSLHLQVSHDICVNCNECAIARACPSGAFKRVPTDKPYMYKHELT